MTKRFSTSMPTLGQVLDAYEKVMLDLDKDLLGDPSERDGEAEAVRDVIAKALTGRSTSSAPALRRRVRSRSVAASGRFRSETRPGPMRATFAIEADQSEDDEGPDCH